MSDSLEQLRQKLADVERQLNPAASSTATDRVFQVLRQAIGELVLKPHETLAEKDLAAALGISKTPVREALIRLSVEGLVLILPRSGSFVAPIVPDDLFEAMVIREALETTAVALAARRIDQRGKFAMRENLRSQIVANEGGDTRAFHRADDDLHRLVVEYSGLRRLSPMLDPIRLTLNRVRHLATPVAGRMAFLLAQHQGIVDAIVGNDVEGASTAMRAHLQALTPFIEVLLRDRPELFAPPIGTRAWSPHDQLSHEVRLGWDRRGNNRPRTDDK